MPGRGLLPPSLPHPPASPLALPPRHRTEGRGPSRPCDCRAPLPPHSLSLHPHLHTLLPLGYQLCRVYPGPRLYPRPHVTLAFTFTLAFTLALALAIAIASPSPSPHPSPQRDLGANQVIISCIG
ncbi:unnamed protein product [Cyclocybe aegerita]|uniref:Uncharacterized protein n=1 Tax=Cyclocybe aegerita TaxID=1973307 RepID=A0A8S0X1C0_CYCAE|nr:unnamed protein product [Cyclocybe aegerita]